MANYGGTGAPGVGGDSHELVASSLAIALRHAGFERVQAIDPDALGIQSDSPTVKLAAGDIALVGLLYGDGRTTLPLIRPLTGAGAACW